ncbi:MAG: hypothetical protein JRJ00_10080 [Deltaproteobacteria bacterium]|jgi:hypothetical protein|nr:hypothetical protein [Deltaproteobacteria bacterium]
MKDKIKVVILCLLIICFFFIGAVIAKAGETGAASYKEWSGKVVAFYFHGNYRCSNCKKIEQYSRDAIEKYFKEQLKTKRLVFNIINIDLPENKHYVEDYQLYTRSLIIAEFKDGKQVRWKNLTKVWNYLNDRDKFYKYVQSEIQKYLENI